MIETCDRVYDKMKHQASYVSAAKKTEVKQKPLMASVDIRQLRLSHVMKIKEMAQAHKGTSKFELAFFASDRRLGTLHLEGIAAEAAFKKALQAIPGIKLEA